MVVQHNLRAMNSNRMLGLTANVQSKSTEKLSSGYKINRAADDAAGLSISEKMRKQIRGLSQASLNAADGISAVQTAEGALNEVQDMLQRMNELAVKASNGTMSEDDRGYIQDEIEQLIDEIDRVAETTKFNETYLLKGDKEGTKATTYNYAEKSDYLGKDKILYTQNSDGTFTQVAQGTLLDDNTTYYSTISSTLTTMNVGDSIDFTAGKVVGDSVDLTAAASSDYIETANVISMADIYSYNSTNSTYESVASGTKYDATASYYSLSAGNGNVDSIAITTASADIVSTQSVVKADKILYDSTGVQIAAGHSVDTSKTHYSSIDKSAVSERYIAEQKLINETGLYVLDTAGKYQSVASGAVYDSDETYYKLTSQSGSVNYVAQSSTPATITGYVAIKSMYDSDGNKVGVNASVDNTKTYFANVVKDSKVTWTGTAVDSSNLDNFKDNTGDFQFIDKEGNSIAENGLYRYFNEDGTYAGGLYKKGAAGEIVEVEDSEVNAYVEKGEAETGALRLSLHVGADATESNQIALDIEAMDASTLGIGEISVAGKDDKNALDAIASVKEALQKVSTQRSALGAVQNRLEHTIANLDNVVENTTAAESQIRDTDMATEMVKYSNNNILAQAGQAMLAQANQANQGVLSILG